MTQKENTPSQNAEIGILNRLTSTTKGNEFIRVLEESREEGPRRVKWRLRLQEELVQSVQFEGWSREKWNTYLASRQILNDNYDTVVALDWPHYCGGATEACGGEKGWCYTLAGKMGDTKARLTRSAMTDQLARQHPSLFAIVVAEEVFALVRAGKLKYANVRFSGSGEVHPMHIAALIDLASRGVRLWGFSRNVDAAIKLHVAGIGVLFSCDSTTPTKSMASAKSAGLGLAYTSIGVDDRPPPGCFVTFPLHRSGRVREVVESDSLCPKVLEEYLDGKRRYGACQLRCTRCHQSGI